MRKNRFTEAQIIGMIKEQEAGRPTADQAGLRSIETPCCHPGKRRAL